MHYLLTEWKSERTTWGFVQAGQDVQSSAVCKAVLLFGLKGILIGFWLLICTFSSLLGLSCWGKELQIPACAKPYTLAVMQ
jgi:hypothetical protein